MFPSRASGSGEIFRRRMERIAPREYARSTTTWKIDGRWIDDQKSNDHADECLVGEALARRLALHPELQPHSV